MKKVKSLFYKGSVLQMRYFGDYNSKANKTFFNEPKIYFQNLPKTTEKNKISKLFFVT